MWKAEKELEPSRLPAQVAKRAGEDLRLAALWPIKSGTMSTAARDRGGLVGRIEDRVLVLTDLSPALG